MSTQTFASYFAILLLFNGSVFLVSRSIFTHRGPDCASIAAAVSHEHPDEDYAHVFLYYPLEKSATGFAVFLNRKSIGRLTSGGRMECRLLLEGPVAITLVDGNTYREPLTQARNSRTVSVKKGKSYYFRIGGNGELEYTFITARGEKSYADAKDFVAQPLSFIETSASIIPALTAGTN